MNRFNDARSLFARCFTARRLRVLCAVAALGTLAPSQAEPPAAQDDPMQAARQLHGEYVELQNRLSLIQEKTIEAHPELQKQQQAFLDLMMAKMASGSDTSPEDDLAALGKLEQKLRSKDTPESERKTLMTEYQEKAMAFRSAQVEALKDPEVQKAQDALRDATVTAMQQQDPQTEQLMKQLQQKQDEMKQLLETAGQGQ
jgi:predicted RNA binding protein with dsRBD fold (UPF0201 family)